MSMCQCNEPEEHARQRGARFTHGQIHQRRFGGVGVAAHELGRHDAHIHESHHGHTGVAGPAQLFLDTDELHIHQENRHLSRPELKGDEHCDDHGHAFEPVETVGWVYKSWHNPRDYPPLEGREGDRRECQSGEGEICKRAEEIECNFQISFGLFQSAARSFLGYWKNHTVCNEPFLVYLATHPASESHKARTQDNEKRRNGHIGVGDEEQIQKLMQN
ncbi:uncharacterized protein BO66DRAFT_403077 [Aspergillus aculeatinus CBS 121060]|uniref:Uncharacterized protein n=1 Tax=Aspergillus aculeatinus CBS 121060 TaxID=1448322 RepID=A0ACD1H4B7_9EURO|nr:hypothetical protein BO66DRAFT_403077 [Aspergillus aculeatinus CBS 121060]RAH68339.1 hypothetical protein BO66DRAFT_403077 [Aspergillus aculeatinus CBS 121060]